MKSQALFEVVTIPHELDIPFPDQVKGDRGISTVRMDKMQILGNHSSKYQLVQHKDVFAGVEASFEANKLPFKLQDVRMFGTHLSSMLARYTIEREINILEKDMHLPMIDVTNSYDGLTKFGLQVGLFRVVCSNGLVAQMPGTEKLLMIKKHSFNNIRIEVMFDKIDEYLNGEKFQKFIDKYTNLTKIPPIKFESLESLLGKKAIEELIMSDQFFKNYEELGENRYAQLQSITQFAREMENTNKANEIEQSILNVMYSN